MREAIPLLLLMCACGAAAWSGGAFDARNSRDFSRDFRESDARGRSVPPGELAADPRFSSLEAHAAAVAPGMRRIAQRETGGERVELVRAGDRDACVRVVFEATTPVVARLIDAEGSELAATHGPMTEGALGEQGPVCVRKGNIVSGVTEGAGARVRWLAWTSP